MEKWERNAIYNELVVKQGVEGNILAFERNLYK